MARLTIPDEITSQTFTVTTSTSSFPISFSLPSGKADLRVKVGDSVLSTSSFSFSGTLLEGGGYDGGTVTLNTAAENTTVIIERRTKIQRATNFAPAASAPVQSVDSELNRLTAIAQDINRRLESGEGGGGGGGGTVEFATFTEMQAGGVEDKAVAPLVMIEGVPAVYRDVICDVRPDPATANDTGGILAAFNGEKTYAPVRIRSRLRTSTILGQPTTGYHYTVDTIPVRVWLNNNSGYNHATDGNTGRTAAAAVRVNATTGTSVQGDTMCYSASGFVQGARPGATSFLANPASVLYAGDINLGADGTYANVREFIVNDNGYAGAAIGDVINLNRTNGSGALKATWIGYRPQSIGSQAIDAFYSASGSSKIGLDFATASLTQAAIALAADQTIHFDATNSTAEKFPDDTAVGSTYLKFNGTSDEFEFWIAGTRAFRFGSAGPAGSARGVATLTANDTVWDITTSDVLYVTANSSATLVTGIASGLPNGTEFTVHFNDANTTLDSNISGGFSLNGFLDVSPPQGAVMTFVKTSANILETSRSFGGLVPGFFTFPDGFSTPEVQSGRPHYKVSNTSATTITNFLNGNGSQEITILATNDNTTIQHNGTTISLVGGSSTVIPSGHTMTLIRDGSLWREINRSFPNTGWSSISSGTTPSVVERGENIYLINGSSTTITNFVGGSNGRLIRLHFTNSNVTLQHSSSLNLRGGSNVTPGNNNIITLIRDYVGNWVEVSRNF